jgi:FkbM family methyltransferase
MLARLAAVSQRLPESLWKVRAGRVLARASLRPVIEVSLRDGTRMVLDARGRVEGEPVWNGRYEPHLIEILERCVPPGGSLLDVGANVGLIAVPMARRLAASGGRVVAVEPIPENAARITQSAAVNGVEIEVFQVALGDARRRVRMLRENGWGASTGNAMLEQVATGISGVYRDVEMETLDELGARIGRVDVIKLDVEGSEVPLLYGGMRYLSVIRPIVHGEFSRRFIGSFGHSFADVAPICDTLKYCVVGWEGDRRPVILEPQPGMRDVLLVPRERVSETFEALEA